MFLDLEIWIDRGEQKFMYKPHTKKISLLLCLQPHSPHPKEVWKGMIHGLLSKCWSHCCRIEDYIAEAQQLHIGLMNRGNCPVILKQLFTEVSKNLKKEKATIGSDPVADVRLEMKVEQDSKSIKKMLLLHQEHHPKDCFEMRITTNL